MRATGLLHDLRQGLWLDNITRDLLNDGTLARYIERNPRTRMAGLGCRLSAAAIGILIAGLPVASAKNAAENAIDQAHVAAGRVWYDKYCTPCHGPGGGPGSAVYRRTDGKVDLRRYVARNNGLFPAHEWIAVVEHVDLTSPHAEVWEQIRHAQAGSTQAGTSSQGAAARGVVALIADYIISVQTK
ncbi:MAG TPA: hypothetical protein VMS22_07340 [Candidatus Eisenbacteria bacterium]|nr:hypothetical protein [Candidatus Eisenbacteria bacterium]